MSAFYCLETPRLESNVLGLKFPAPLGLAAGFDKSGRVVDTIGALGFGFLEIGAVSLLPAGGNPKPRLYRLTEDLAILNNMGLNNDGSEQVLQNLAWHQLDIPLGINLVKTNDPKIEGADAVNDFVNGFAQMCPAASFVVLNLSCPNTADGRTFEDPPALTELLREIFIKRDELLLDTPVLLKLSPDTTEQDLQRLFDAAEQFDVEGYVLSNTTTRRDGLKSILPSPVGGVSGQPLQARTLERVRFAKRVLPRERLIIACGGVDSVETMLALMKAGASLVELYSALIYEGPGVCQKILLELLRLLDREGVQHASEIIGVELK